MAENSEPMESTSLSSILESTTYQYYDMGKSVNNCYPQFAHANWEMIIINIWSLMDQFELIFSDRLSVSWMNLSMVQSQLNEVIKATVQL